MYKKIIINLAMALVSPLALPLALADTIDALEESTALAAAADSSFYIETPVAAKLTKFDKDVTGNMSVSMQVTVPERSILAVNLSTFSMKANEEWVCGIRIVDVQDEDLRESDISDEQDFCIRSSDIKKAGLLDSSNGKNKEAFLNYQKTGQLSELNDLSFAAKNQQQQNVQLFAATTTLGTKMVSPLNNCGVGCLFVTSEYGMRKHPVHKTKRLHKGIDLRAKTGAQVVSVFDGKVLATRTERNAKTKKMKGYGHYVIVIHPQRQIETLYAHLSAFKTQSGKPVAQGQTIALSGNTGVGTAPHLHFEIHKLKNKSYIPVNPRTYVNALLNVSL
ncbi:MAG: M23 family metallopeptidase [Bdellovibrionota bacterium]